jgi:LAGLIDADG-like domain
LARRTKNKSCYIGETLIQSDNTEERLVKEKTKAYMAGLMDAEGSFTIATCKHNTMGHQLYDPTIRCASTFYPVLKWAVKHFGGTVYKHHPSEGSVLPAWDWSTDSYKHSEKFLSYVHPYLILKKREAEVLKTFYGLYRQQVPEQRQALYEMLKNLKKRESLETNTQDFLWKKNLINAYFAGFFDGEGSIYYFNHGGNVKVCLGNTAKNLLVVMSEMYGGYVRPLTGRPNHHTPIFNWELTKGTSVETFLLQVLPYLQIKREKANNALIFLRRKKIESALPSDRENSSVKTQKD